MNLFGISDEEVELDHKKTIKKAKIVRLAMVMYAVLFVSFWVTVVCVAGHFIHKHW